MYSVLPRPCLRATSLALEDLSHVLADVSNSPGISSPNTRIEFLPMRVLNLTDDSLHPTFQLSTGPDAVTDGKRPVWPTFAAVYLSSRRIVSDVQTTSLR